ncbi:MAG: hypothetical protein Q8930_07430 [Bacillota bacterium]|nr:hypothetical protein [Bacillota bacterium]
MPSRDEKSRQDYFERKAVSDAAERESSRTIAYEDDEFEMMSIPDGGAGNKMVLENLKRAGK